MRRLFLLIILQMAMLSASVYAYEDLKLNYIPTNDSVKWCHLTPQGDIVLCGTKYGEDSIKIYFHRVSDGQLLGVSAPFSTNCLFARFADCFVVRHVGAMEGIDYQTGKSLWILGNALDVSEKQLRSWKNWPQDGTFVHPLQQNDTLFICLCTDYKKGDSTKEVLDHVGNNTKCICYSAKTGQTLWEKPFNSNNYIEFLGMVDGSRYFCRNNKFAYRNYGMLDLSTGDYYSQTGPIFDHQFFINFQYLAGRSFLVEMGALKCFDSDLNVLWKASLPKFKMSGCRLYALGDTLVMVNYGAKRVSMNSLVPFGKPFVAAFDMNSGKRLFLQQLSKSKECFYRADVSSKKVSVLSGRHMVNVYLSDGHKEHMQWKPVPHGEPLVLSHNEFFNINAGRNFFVRLGQGFDCVVDSDVNAYRYFADSEPKQIATHASLYSIRHTLENGNLCIQGGADDGDCWIITPEGKALYHIPELGNILICEKNTLLFTSYERKVGYFCF